VGELEKDNQLWKIRGNELLNHALEIVGRKPGNGMAHYGDISSVVGDILDEFKVQLTDLKNKLSTNAVEILHRRYVKTPEDAYNLIQERKIVALEAKLIKAQKALEIAMAQNRKQDTALRMILKGYPQLAHFIKSALSACEALAEIDKDET